MKTVLLYEVNIKCCISFHKKLCHQSNCSTVVSPQEGKYAIVHFFDNIYNGIMPITYLDSAIYFRTEYIHFNLIMTFKQNNAT